MMTPAFQQAKADLSSATWLQHLDPTAHIALHVDASATHIGAVLQEQSPDNQNWSPLGFFSKKLSSSKVK